MTSSNRKSFLIGIFVLSFGVLWFFRVLGVLGVEMGYIYSVFWPSFLILWGLDSLLGEALFSGPPEKKTRLEKLGALILVIFGGIALGVNLEYFEIDYSIIGKLILPLILIVVGWNFLRGVSGTGKKSGSSIAMMSGIEMKEEGWELKNNNYFALMGGIELDLSKARINQENVVLNLTAIMGGMTLLVPQEYTVECSGTVFLGGIEFYNDEFGGLISRRQLIHSGTGESKKVVLDCKVIMGGIEIKGV